MELKHHGIKGQKWGVRRFQNSDGTLTYAGKRRYLEARRWEKEQKTRKDVETIIRSMSKDDQRKLGVWDRPYMDEGYKLVYRTLKKEGDMPVAFFDIKEYGKELNIVIGTHPDYRNKGYANEVAKRGMNYLNRNRKRYEGIKITWIAREDNDASIAIAKKSGFKHDPKSDYGTHYYDYDPENDTLTRTEKQMNFYYKYLDSSK